MTPLEEKLLNSLLVEATQFREVKEIFSLGILVRLMRNRLSMTQRQLAKRAQVAQSTINRIENEEISPSEKTLQQIFHAMGCDLFFIPMPHQNIDEFIRNKAQKVAEERIQYIEGTMALENQKPDKKWRDTLLETEIERLLKNPSELWDNDD